MDERKEKLIKRIAKNIRAIRISKNLTQEDMADYGFGPRWYQRLESGKHMPTLPTLIKLARAFRVDIVDFLK
jgi:transcriptional regulator with XRE-family HTH domain